MSAPQGWPQQPTPPPGWQPPPPPGPRKSKLPVVMTIIALVVPLAVLGTGGFLYLKVNSSQGSPKRSVSQPRFCEKVRAETLKIVRTTNPNDVGSYETPVGDSKVVSCAWDMTWGSDGTGWRALTVYYEQTAGKGPEAFKLRADKAQNSARAQVEDGGSWGDQAIITWQPRDGDYAELNFIVRKGDNVLHVEYSGWDAGFFSRDRPAMGILKSPAMLVIDDILRNL